MSSEYPKSPANLFPVLNDSSLPHAPTRVRRDTSYHDPYKQVDLISICQSSLLDYDQVEEENCAATVAATADPSDPTQPEYSESLLSRSSAGQKSNDFAGDSRATRERLESTTEGNNERLQKLTGAVRTILECVGEDPEREGLRDTPERYAKAMLYFTKGYEENVLDLVNGAVFHEDHDELVIVKDIDVFSLCEHHMVPFTGQMHIGYIPDRRVIGLSKLARLAEMFSHRLQVQERLTKQVALAISDVLKPLGVGVVMQSSHLCMVMRGVQKVGSSTITSCMLGCMKSSVNREEFLSHLHGR
ncbi:hypothetical protein PENANT_c080G02565 [Penicillium antarcticum]|uniref:GTP cyclohydrolase 1 n=1 Tax=Penicillium antarcticum TaxID=416450 RepID=A0A1V6PPC7_9EURO|nr:hypothetical protein PENANT_c080G02565 [Penicillium antarcticum]